jgi:hypothetical protein
MTSYHGILLVVSVLVVATLLLMVAGGYASSGNAEMQGSATAASSSCPTMPDCAASPSCSQHCSSLIRDDSRAPLTPAVTSARSQIEPVIVQAVAADVHKPPPRLTKRG